MNTDMTTKEQKRAAYALEQINEYYKIKENEKTVPEKDANFYIGLPTMILTNGLGQTLAFILSKANQNKNDKYGIAFKIIKNWLCNIWKGNFKNEMKDSEFLIELTTIDQNRYIEGQKETLAMLNWLKRYVRAFQKGSQVMEQ